MTEGKEIQYLLPGSEDKCVCGKIATASVGRFDTSDVKKPKWIQEAFICRTCLDKETQSKLLKDGYMTSEQARMLEPGMVLEIRSNWAQGRMKCPRKNRILAIKPGTPSQTGIIVTIKMESGENLELDASWFIPPKNLIPF